MIRPALLAVFASLAAAAPAPLQGGWTTEKHPALGLTFPRARTYEQVPVQPGEEFIVLLYAEKVPDKPRPGQEERSSSFRPELNVVWIDALPARKPEPDGGPPPAPAPEDGPTGGSSGGSAKEKSQPPPIDSIERWVEQRLSRFELGPGKEGRTKKGWVSREHTLEPIKKGSGPRMPVRGWAYAWRGANRTVAFVGLAHEDDFAGQVEIWRESAEKVDLDDPEEQSTAKLERMYARSPLRAPEFRIEVRRNLVRGWKAEDTENFIVVYDSPDQPLVRRVINDLEIIRKEYVRLFPSVAPVTAVSTVRICKNQDEYLTYGGMPGSAGYWNSESEELVLFDIETERKGGGASDTNTFLVLYHEAFHQYIHYSTGELPPHSWFNEGHGDFFGGARIKGGKVKDIGPNLWRIELIQAMIAADRSLPWKDILAYEQPEFYQPDRRGLCYAQGWAMVYFLRTAGVVQKKPEWARILPTYFDTLKEVWTAERARLEAEGKFADRAEKQKAEVAARKKALETAFRGVSLGELERAWTDFVLAIELPR